MLRVILGGTLLVSIAGVSLAENDNGARVPAVATSSPGEDSLAVTRDLLLAGRYSEADLLALHLLAQAEATPGVDSLRMAAYLDVATDIVDDHAITLACRVCGEQVAVIEPGWNSEFTDLVDAHDQHAKEVHGE